PLQSRAKNDPRANETCIATRILLPCQRRLERSVLHMAGGAGWSRGFGRTDSHFKVYQVGTTLASAQGDRSEAVPGWLDKLPIGLVIYVAICSIWMQAGFGGERVRHYIGLLGRFPASFVAVVVAVAAAYRLAPGAQKT